MAIYRVEIRGGTKRGERYKLDASSVEEAARLCQRVVIGISPSGTWAKRVTGDVGQSGVFQFYVPLRGGGNNSIGPSYHVAEVQS